ncbi:MAG TPA: hypothetical protein VEI98_15435 [Xanthobacteraceae bacterium]|nr:hypothetical protein [Xanthobacteraceae bacterium]
MRGLPVAAAVGALAVGALAISRVAIGIAIERARFANLKVEELTVRKPHVVENRSGH